MKSNELAELYKENQAYMNRYFNDAVKMVFGDGNPDSAIVLIGEAPGKHEVEQGRPFVGMAGRNLEEFIDILNIKREDLYITNIVKFRPFKVNPDTGREANRPPTREEVRISTDFIMRELDILAPRLVVTLGNVALKCVLNDDSASIGVLHGNPLEIKLENSEFKLFPLYHPASIIYRRELKEVYLEDLRKLGEYIHKQEIV